MTGLHPCVPVDPLTPWLGGKRLLARTIAGRIATIPHACYAEPFVGAGGLFFRRRCRPAAEAINDAHGEVSNLFRIVQRHPEALATTLRWCLTARAEFRRLQDTPPHTLTDIERAARFLTLQGTVFGGKITGRTWGFSPTKPSRFRAGRMMRLIEAAHRRLQGVYIDGDDFEAFLQRWDRPSTLFFLDPPYWGSEHFYGRDLWSRDDFVRLERALRGLSGSFLLSLNDTPEVRALFAGYTIEPLTTLYSIGTGVPGTRSQSRGEVLISRPKCSSTK